MGSAGDSVWVSGRLGSARAALDAMLHGAAPPAEARRAFARPRPRIGTGQALSRLGATAMIDLSDGLGGDAGHLAAASKCRIEIDLGAVPLGPGVVEEAARALSRCGTPPEAANYELLFTLPGAPPRSRRRNRDRDRSR
jgi:thiamine-monophosphate kinase